MGLLSNLVKTVKSSVVGKVLDTATVALAHPVETAVAVMSPKKTVSQVIESHYQQPLKTQLVDTFLGTAGLAATVVGAGVLSTAAKAGTLLPAAATAAKSLIPKTLAGKAALAVSAHIAVGALKKEPEKIISTVIKAPSELQQFGGDVATFSANPSVSTAKEIVKNSPIISAGVALATAGTVGSTVASTVSNYLNREAVKEQTEVFKQQLDVMKQQTPVGSQIQEIPSIKYSADEKVLSPSTSMIPSTPQTAQTKSVNNISKIKSPKRSYKPKINNISQRVNVIVNNRSSSIGIKQNRRYLNKPLMNYS